MDARNFSTPLDLRQVRIDDDFWAARQRTVRREVIPYQWAALNDAVEGAAPSYCMHNFKAAARMMRRKRSAGAAYVPPRYTYRGFESLPEDPANPDPDKFYGFVFQDTDFSKWIEAVAYSLTISPDPELEKTADEAIAVVCAAQHESGYLDTYYILNGMDRAFTNLRDHHELYCLGHLVEGAVAYYQATGKDALLKAACRFADYTARRFGPAPEQCKGYPGHEIAEMALVRLYEATGEKRYLELSRFFINQRGTQPPYFEQEAERRAALDGESFKPNTDPKRYEYYQAHKPVREQTEAVGHAVRAGYLYCGMADIARLTQDGGLLDACRRLWRSIVDEKLYITGGVGGTSHGEAFSYPYDLPNDSAYSETCAAIALVFFARRMLQIEPKAEYADVMERALYNTVLAGMALDGKSFFYVNPLEVVPSACLEDKHIEHVKPTRQKWFGCACCPPNIARTVTSLAAYAYTENASTLWVHLYVGGTVETLKNGGKLSFAVESGLPWEGNVKLAVKSGAANCSIALRLPSWCGGQTPVINYPAHLTRRDSGGYCYLSGEWAAGDTVTLTLPMPILPLAANSAVREDAGKIAFIRGPITYCAEEADNGKNLHLLRVDTARLGEATAQMTDICGVPVAQLLVPAVREEPCKSNSPLYRVYAAPKCERATLRLIPYFAWANRGEGEMRVWLRT